MVLDLIMPQMGGEKCLEELSKLNPNVKVLVASGHSLHQVEQDMVGHRVRGFVNKPFRLKEFVELVRGVLDAE